MTRDDLAAALYFVAGSLAQDTSPERIEEIVREAAEEADEPWPT